MRAVFFFFLLSYCLSAFPSNKGDDLADFGAQSFKYQDKHYLALTLKNHEGWHTYWKNPGDAGLPFQAEFLLDGQALELEELEWPVPHKYMAEGDVLSYGYEGVHTFFYKLPPLKKGLLEIKGNWLICKEVCIPGGRTLKGELSSGEYKNLLGNEIELSQKELTQNFESLPQRVSAPINLSFRLLKEPGQDSFILLYELKGDYKNINSSMNFLTPYPVTPLGFKREKLFQHHSGSLIGYHTVDWDGDFQEPAIALPANGKFTTPIKVKFLLNFPEQENINYFDVTFNSFEEKQLHSFLPEASSLKEIKHNSAHSKEEHPSDQTIWSFLFFAFLGGLILNLMPCVLPVISLKLFGLIVHSDLKKKDLIKHNLVFTLGVVSTLWAFACVILAIKATGQEIGWGFQLQSPLFVMCMLLFLFILSLNLFGLFEFVTPGGRTLGNAQMKKGLVGDFFSGVLATVLSTPCSAPFLGTALTFAFTTTSFNIFLVFTMIGLGLSFPFILTAFFPQLISFLPKPGAWMEKMKNFLGLTLLITCAWLYDVLMNLSHGQVFNMPMNVLLILTFFAFFFYQKMGKTKIAKLFFIALPLLSFSYVVANHNILLRPSNESNVTSSQNSQWQAWSQEKMNAVKDRPVFIDFTASWCLTCKVNKKLVLDTSSFYQFAKENDITLMKADWTKRDDKITKFLKSYGAVGVPAYFIQTKSGEVKYLGETISLSKIEEAL